MKAIGIFIYISIFIIFSLISYAVLQIKLIGMKVKDFWGFVEANQSLDRLYRVAMKYEMMSQQEQVVFLMEAEKVFKAFEKVPEMLWEDDYDKYENVLDAYRNIKILRWAN